MNKILLLLLFIGLVSCDSRYRTKKTDGTPDIIYSDKGKKPGDTIFEMRAVWVMDTLIIQSKY